MDTRNKTKNATQSFNQSGLRDKFCWICHKKCMRISCPKCFRSFHEKCLKASDNCRWTDDSLEECTVCTVKETSKAAYVGMGRLLRLLKYTMADILKSPDFRVFKDLSSLNEISSYCDVVVNPMDLDDIAEKIERGFYDSFYEFLVDIECIYHNCYVHYSEHHELTKLAKCLFEFCEHETEVISNCAECYENQHLYPSEWRVMTCNKPHVVLWARLRRSLNFWPAKKGFTHWPAKLIFVDDDDDLEVVFFESSEVVGIPVQDCWLYSTEHSDSLNQRSFNPNYIEAALNEVNLYANNVEKKFGRFQKELGRIQFDVDRLDDYMIAMFPDYDGSVKVTPTQSRAIEDEVGVSPAKRPRLSTDDAFGGGPSHAPTSTNPVVTIKRHMQIIEQEVIKLENTNDLKLQATIKELNNSKKALADVQKQNRKLVDDLEAVSAERDQTKEVLAIAKDMHAKEIAAINEAQRKKLAEVNIEVLSVRAMEQMKAETTLREVKSKHRQEMDGLKVKHRADHSEFMFNMSQQLAKRKRDMDQIKAENRRYSGKFQDIESRMKKIAENFVIVATERNKAKTALIKAKEEHTKEMAALNVAHNQRMTDVKKNIERILAEKMTVEADFRKAKRVHDSKMEVLRTQLHTSHLNMMKDLEIKLQKEHDQEVDQRVSNGISEQKMEQRRKIAEFKGKVEAIVKERFSF